MTLDDIAENRFGNVTDNFTDEIDDAIKQAVKSCNSASLRTLVGFLEGDIEWQGSVLRSLAGDCAKKLDDEQIERVEKLLSSGESSIRRSATGVLGWTGKWPNQKLLSALYKEQKKTVLEPMLATVLGLAGVPDRQSVRLAMDTVASGVPITEQLVDDLIAKHGGRS